jgi:hypothetical protein
MTDNTTDANQDLGLTPPNEPAAPAMSVAEAVSRKNELIHDTEFRDLLFNGDVGATAKWCRVVDSISRPPETPMNPQEAAASAAFVRTRRLN